MAKTRKTEAAAEKPGLLVHANSARIWLVVADACHARVLEGDRMHSGVALVLETAAPRVSHAARSRGRPIHHSHDLQERHVVAPMRSLKAHERQIFFSRLADYLSGNAGRFDWLVLIAPAPAMQQMARTFSKPVLDKVIERRKEDITWMSAPQILDHIGVLGKQMRRVRRPANPLPSLKRKKARAA